MRLVKPQCFFEPDNPLEYQPRSSRAIRFLHDRDHQGDLPREWEDCNAAPPPLNAHQQAGRGDTGACWHPPQASVYSDKITHRAMSWRGHSGTLYLRVKTLTNLPPRLRSVKGSKCTWVCQRRTQRVDMGPYQARWRNGHRTIAASHQLRVWRCVPKEGAWGWIGSGGGRCLKVTSGDRRHIRPHRMHSLYKTGLQIPQIMMPVNLLAPRLQKVGQRIQ